MKSTGMVRQLDTLGRIVIPVELRRTMDLSIKDTLEIFVDGDQIVLKKYHPACIFCNDARLFHFSYQRYLENQIREVFGLNGTPIRITIRQRGDKEDE
mgnify:CR=1 FL=1